MSNNGSKQAGTWSFGIQVLLLAIPSVSITPGVSIFLEVIYKNILIYWPLGGSTRWGVRANMLLLTKLWAP